MSVKQSCSIAVTPIEDLLKGGEKCHSQFSNKKLGVLDVFIIPLQLYLNDCCE